MAGFHDELNLPPEDPLQSAQEQWQLLTGTSHDLGPMSKFSQGLGILGDLIDDALPTTSYDDYIPNVKTLLNLVPGVGDLETGLYTPLDVLLLGADVFGAGTIAGNAMNKISFPKKLTLGEVKKATNKGIAWQEGWNDNFMSRALRTSEETHPLAIVGQKAQHSKLADGTSHYVTYEKDLRTPLEKLYKSRENYLGRAELGGKRMDIPMSNAVHRKPIDIMSTAIHEADHLTAGGTSKYDDNLINSILSPKMKEAKDAHWGYKKGTNEYMAFDEKYYAKGHEIHARIQQVRHALGWNSFDDMPVSWSKDAMKNGLPKQVKKHRAYKDLLKVMDKKDVITLVSKMSGLAPASIINEGLSEKDKMRDAFQEMINASESDRTENLFKGID
jgi:hypothetical protein